MNKSASASASAVYKNWNPHPLPHPHLYKFKIRIRIRIRNSCNIYIRIRISNHYPTHHYCSRDGKGKKRPDQLHNGSKRHFLHGSSLGPYLTFWSKVSKIFVRHLGFWRPSWVLQPEIDFSHIFGHRKVSNGLNFTKMHQDVLKSV